MLRKKVSVHSGNHNNIHKAQSRSGGLLIIVVVMMAIALILITSAMTITVASRKHYYDNSLSSQANLTAVSAAKSISEAILSGNIRDAEVRALAGEGSPVVISSAASAASDAAMNTSNTFTAGLKNSSGSKTTATFSYYPAGSNETNFTYIVVKIETTLSAGASTTPALETVSFLLEKKPVTVIGDAFGSIAMFGADSTVTDPATVNSIARTKIGAGTVDSTPVVIHGDVTVSGSDLILDTNIAFTGQVKFAASCVYNKDVIFYGDNASIYNDVGGGLTCLGSMFVLGNTSTSSLFTNAAKVGAPLINAGGYTINGGFYLTNKYWEQSENWLPIKPAKGVTVDSNATVKFTANPSDVAVYYLRAAASAQIITNGVADATIETAATYPIITELQAKAAAYRTQIAPNVARVLPTTTEALAELGLTGKGSTGAAIVANLGATQIPTTNFHTAETTAAPMYSYPTGTTDKYYINVGSGLTLGTGSSNSHTSIIFDLSGRSIDLYLIGGGTFTLDSGLIQFINGSDTNIGRIILLDGTDIMIGPAWESWKEDSGIIGTPRTTLGGLRTTYVPLSKPYVYVYGTGYNTIRAYGKGGSLEGFIGLWGPQGKLDLETFLYFYGRIESTYFTSEGGATAGGNPIPYCPSPKSSSSIPGLPVAVTSAYQLVGYITE